MQNRKKILVTGANGLLGSHAVKKLSLEHEIHALVHAATMIPVEGVTYQVLDFATNWQPEVLPKKMDMVIHLAQSARFREFPEQAMDIFNVNIASTAKLLDYARRCGASTFILASSGGVYGAGDDAFKENAVIPHHGKLGYYLGSKLCAEVVAQNYSSLMNVAVLRFFFMYGKGQKRSMLVPRLIDNVLSSQPISLEGEEGIRINPIHVSDAVEALDRCLSLEGSHTFNVAGMEVLSLREIAEIIGRAVGCDPVFKVEAKEPRHLIADIDALKRHLVEPKVGFSKGIQELIPPHCVAVK